MCGNLAGRPGKERTFQTEGTACTKARGRRLMLCLGVACRSFFLLGWRERTWSYIGREE